MPSPVSLRLPQQNRTSTSLGGLGSITTLETPGVRGGRQHQRAPRPRQYAAARLPPFHPRPEYGGHVKIDEDDYLWGAPDLVAEVAASSVSYDMHDKLQAYQDATASANTSSGECWTSRSTGSFFAANGMNSSPRRQTASCDSIAFPGLWLDVGALLCADLNAVLAMVQQGLKSTEHANFVCATATSRRQPSSLTAARLRFDPRALGRIPLAQLPRRFVVRWSTSVASPPPPNIRHIKTHLQIATAR